MYGPVHRKTERLHEETSGIQGVWWICRYKINTQNLITQRQSHVWERTCDSSSCHSCNGKRVLQWKLQIIKEKNLVQKNVKISHVHGLGFI